MEAPAPALPPPEDVRQLFADLVNVDDADGLRRAILQLGQRQLQDRFRRVYLRATWSNNNTWLRRRLLEGAPPPTHDAHVLARSHQLQRRAMRIGAYASSACI